jgi:hypothetical protein
VHKIGDLLKELGFNKDAPIETQKAFLRHLAAKAEPCSREREKAKAEDPEQLSFDPKILGCGVGQAR